MLAIFLLFIVLSSGAVFGCFLLGKDYKFGEYAPVSCMTVVLLLFLFGLFNALKAGFWVLVASCIAVYALSIYKMVVNGKTKAQQKVFFSQGFWFFVLLFASVIWIDFGMQVHDWDEFSHWALVVKEMNAVNVLPSNPAVRFTFYKTYPPALPLFDYFLLKLNNGVFLEWLLYAANHIFLLSLFMPFIEKLDLTKWSSWLIIPSMWLAPIVFFDNAYEGLYVDAFLGVLCGICFAAVSDNEKDNKLQNAFILLGIATLELTKEVGFLFAVFVAIVFVLDKRNAKSGWIISALVVPEALWKALLKINNVTGQARGKIDISSLINLISGGEDIYRRHIINAFMRIFNAYYLVSFLLIAASLFFIFCLEKKTRIWVSMMVQAVLYLAGMLLMYMYLFDYREGSALASYGRYIGIIFEAMLVCLIVCCATLKEWPGTLFSVAALLFVLTTIPYDELYNVLSRRNVSLAASIRQPVEEEYCKMIREKYEPGSRVCYGSGDSATMEFFESRYILAPDYDVYWEE